MSAKGTGGPAFPVPKDYDEHGMDLRDYFAAKALAALINHPRKDGENCGKKAVTRLAGFAYEYADAMLEVRSRPRQITKTESVIPVDEKRPWTHWNGGKCPVDDDGVLVEVLLEGDELDSSEAPRLGIARNWDWNSREAKIVAYRVLF